MDETEKPITPTQQFSARLRAACQAAMVDHTSPTAVSAKIGKRNGKVILSASLADKYLNAKTNIKRISGQMLCDIADALDCSSRWLTTGMGDPRWKVPQTQEQAEVLAIMRKLDDEGIATVLSVARGEAAKKRVAPTTDRMRPLDRTQHSAP